MAVTKSFVLGRVRLYTLEEGLPKKFGRFEGDDLNGWTEAKGTHAGAEGEVIEVFCDQTVTIQFENGEKLDFPFEAIAEQLTEAPKQTITGLRFEQGGAKLKNLPAEEFEACFHRFKGDSLNYWNEHKQAKVGTIGIIAIVYGDDTVTMLFDDGEKWDFPFEAIERNVKVRFVQVDEETN